jgi:hypothetical protein
VRVTERGALVVGTFTIAGAALVVGIARENLRGFFFPFSEGLLALVFVLAGAVVVRARRDHAVGRLLMWGGFVVTLAQFVAAFETGVQGDPTAYEGPTGLLGTVLRITGVVLLGAVFARFPDGTWTTRGARASWLAVVGLFAAQITVYAWSEFGPTSLPGPEAAWLVPIYLVLPTMVLTAALAVVHLLRADPIRRRQVGWVLLAFGASVLLEAVSVGFGLDLGFLRWFVLSLVPVSIVVAITRYRLYEIDRVVSRTISYGAVLAAMAAVYVGVFAGLTLLLPGQGDDLTVAIATLAAVAASVPLVRRVRAWVDRRFFRSRYDAAEIVASFASDLRGTIDESAVVGRAETVLDEVFAPEAVGVWVARS